MMKENDTLPGYNGCEIDLLSSNVHVAVLNTRAKNDMDEIQEYR